VLETHAMTTGLGTLRYEAPELLFRSGKAKYGVGVDVWAFGAIWFEVLSNTDVHAWIFCCRKDGCIDMPLGRVPDRALRCQAARGRFRGKGNAVVDLHDSWTKGVGSVSSSVAVEPIPPTLCSSLGAEAVDGRWCH